MGDSATTGSGDGRRVVVFLGLLLVAVVTFVGYAIGDMWAKPEATVKLFGLVAVPVTGPTIAIYSAATALVILGAVFGAAEYLNRVETR